MNHELIHTLLNKVPFDVPKPLLKISSRSTSTHSSTRLSRTFVIKATTWTFMYILSRRSSKFTASFQLVAFFCSIFIIYAFSPTTLNTPIRQYRITSQLFIPLSTFMSSQSGLPAVGKGILTSCCGVRHAPDMQLVPGRHTFPQVPQFWVSEAVSVHVPLHNSSVADCLRGPHVLQGPPPCAACEMQLPGLGKFALHHCEQTAWSFGVDAVTAILVSKTALKYF